VFIYNLLLKFRGGYCFHLEGNQKSVFDGSEVEGSKLLRKVFKEQINTASYRRKLQSANCDLLSVTEERV